MEFCPGYFDELVGPSRVRYEAKIAMCSGVDPYKLRIDATTDAEVLPPTTHVDIINYLVLSTSYISLQRMKTYKSLDGGAQLFYEWDREEHCSEAVVVTTCRRVGRESPPSFALLGDMPVPDSLWVGFAEVLLLLRQPNIAQIIMAELPQHGSRVSRVSKGSRTWRLSKAKAAVATKLLP
ncbi:hypothetical protein HPB52_003216 [Rhipicephalus sanguineus]|uniref:Uncharacterized protein n=1 Tax=Rhipicephalus sanguineus TaxID=34632 RepID=A0A9D4Q8S8_RHISA|nr:hypothetical protein HPB52_003216 [Rhipicephalus sanguineus]